MEASYQGRTRLCSARLFFLMFGIRGIDLVSSTVCTAACDKPEVIEEINRKVTGNVGYYYLNQEKCFKEAFFQQSSPTTLNLTSKDSATGELLVFTFTKNTASGCYEIDDKQRLANQTMPTSCEPDQAFVSFDCLPGATAHVYFVFKPGKVSRQCLYDSTLLIKKQGIQVRENAVANCAEVSRGLFAKIADFIHMILNLFGL